jgi:hypothetical protein
LRNTAATPAPQVLRSDLATLQRQLAAQAAELEAERFGRAARSEAGQSLVGELNGAQEVLAAVTAELEKQRASGRKLAATGKVGRRPCWAPPGLPGASCQWRLRPPLAGPVAAAAVGLLPARA